MKSVNWIAVVVLGASAWAIAFIVFWLTRSGCLAPLTIECNDAPLAWFERLISLAWVKGYQELVAGILALVAAIIVGAPVYQQLKESRRQSAAAAIPNFRQIAVEVEEYLLRVESLKPSITRLTYLLSSYDTDRWTEIYDTWPGKVDEGWDRLNEFRIELENAVDRKYLAKDSRGPDGVALCKKLLEDLMRIQWAFRLQTTGPYYEDGEDDLPDGEAERSRTEVGKSLDAWSNWSEGYIAEVRERRRTIWQKVRFLEDNAVGGVALDKVGR